MKSKLRIGLALLAFLGATAAVVVVTNQPALAAGACARTYNDTTTEVAAAPSVYRYGTPTHHTVDCSTISIRSLEDGSVCAQFRVRFFPSGGGSSTAGAWHTNVCGGQAVNLATNVITGTEYRIESRTSSSSAGGARSARVRD